MIEFKLDKNKIKVVTSNLDEIREYLVLMMIQQDLDLKVEQDL